ncbi:MAG TPA: hypothetical protein VM617_02690 [Thermoanaerobaculia bacterium]|nr:hypothetical protein [Thermoanaerobaculia bacterium]
MSAPPDDPGASLRELGRSSLRFSLAMSMHGLQQMVRLLTPPRASDPFRTMLASLDAVSRTMERQLGAPLEVTQKVGDALQQSFLELVSPAAVAGPARSPLPAATGDWLEEGLRRLTPRVIASLHRALGADGVAALRAESANKVALDRIISGVFEIPADEVHEGLAHPLARVRRRPPAAVPWALLALGRRWAAAHHEREARPARGDRSWVAAAAPADHLFLQMGIATELASRRCRDLEPWTPASQVWKLVERQAAEFQGLALPGCERLSAEVLGRALVEVEAIELLRGATPHLRSVDRRSTDALWHGVGRGAYLSAASFVPELGDRWPGLRRCDEDPPDDRAAARMTAGFVFALVVVNAAVPEVVVRFLAEPARRRPGVGDGLTAGLQALSATLGEAGLAPWREAVAASGEAADAAPLALALERSARQPERLDALFTGAAD